MVSQGLHSFPTRRSSDLFVNYVGAEVKAGEPLATVYSPEMLTAQRTYIERLRAGTTAFTSSERAAARERLLDLGLTEEDRKSTRLNSSHPSISYAVFCLK